MGFPVPSLEDDEMLIWGPRGEARPAPRTHTLSHLHTQQNQSNLIVKLWNEQAHAHKEDTHHPCALDERGYGEERGHKDEWKGAEGVQRGEQDNKPIIGLRETFD